MDLKALLQGMLEGAFKQLPGDWVDQIYESDFSDMTDELPLDYLETYPDITEVFTQLEDVTVSLSTWYEKYPKNLDESGGNCPASVFLTTLTEEKIRMDSVFAFLAFHISKGVKDTSNILDRRNFFTAARLGLLLNSLPGTFAYSIFNAPFFEICIQTERIVPKLNLKRAPGAGVASGGGRNKRSRGASAAAAGSEIELEMGSDFSLTFSVSVTDSTLKLILDLVTTLYLVLRATPILQSLESVEHCIKVLLDLVMLERPSANPLYGMLRAITNKVGTTLLILVEKNTTSGTNSSVALQRVFINFYRSLAKVVDCDTITGRELSAVTDRYLEFLERVTIQIGAPAHRHLFIVADKLSHFSIERAEPRQRTMQCCFKILTFCPRPVFLKLSRFYCDLCECKVNQRLLAIDMVAKLFIDPKAERRGFLSEPPGEEEYELRPPASSSVALTSDKDETTARPQPRPSPLPPPLPKPRVTNATLLEILFKMVDDFSPQIRTKALNLISDCVSSKNQRIIATVRQVLIPSTGFEEELFRRNRRNRGRETVPVAEIPLVHRVIMRTVDVRVHVRKAALSILCSLIECDEAFVTKTILSCLSAACTEQSMLNRKFIAARIVDLLNVHKQNERLLTVFVENVIPMCSDPEDSVQDVVVGLVHSVILENLHRRKTEPSRSPAGRLPWLVLKYVRTLKVENSLVRVISLVADKKRLKHQSIREVMAQKLHIIQEYLDSNEFEDEAWMLYSLIIPHIQCPDPTLVVKKYVSCLHDPDRFVPLRVARCLNSCISLIPWDQQTTLMEMLQTELIDHKLPVDMIEDVFISAHAVYHLKEGALRRWLSPVFERVTSELDHLEDEDFDEDHVLTERLFLTFGEAVTYMEVKPKDYYVLMIQTLSTSGLQANADERATERIQCVALVSLGKMMLRNSSIAEESIPMLGRILQKDSVCTANVRVVAINLFRDTVVRYGTLGDSLLSCIFQLLQDDCARIRSHCLDVLVYLLQRDHLKMKSHLFLCLLSATLDKDPYNHDLAKYMMVYRLNKMAKKNLFALYFVQALFFFNGIEHNEFNPPSEDDLDQSIFALPGNRNRRNRKALYRLLLTHVADADRLQITYDLCHKVLRSAVEERLIINDQTVHLFEDIFKILGSDSIRVQYLRRPEGEEEEAEGDGAEREVSQPIRKALVAQLNAATLVDYVLPEMLAFKNMLLQKGATDPLHLHLRSYLAAYLAELSRLYKSDLKKFVDNHQWLATEVSDEISRYSREKDAGKTLDLMQGAETEEEDLVVPAPSVDGAGPSSGRVLILPEHQHRLAREAMEMMEGFRVQLENLERDNDTPAILAQLSAINASTSQSGGRGVEQMRYGVEEEDSDGEDEPPQLYPEALGAGSEEEMDPMEGPSTL